MRLAFALLLLGVSACAPAEKPEGKRDAKLVRGIEARIPMPQGAFPVGEYTRFYALDQKDGRDAVKAVLIKMFEMNERIRSSPTRGGTAVEGVTGVYAFAAVGDLPAVDGGGCWVVETTFDLTSQAFVPAPECHDRM